MARRIEVELTSTKDSDTWTWRAAGARQPKGEVATTLLYPDAKVGDVVKVEAEFHLDGIEVVEVFAPKTKKESTNFLDIISTPLRDDELVTEVRAKKGRSGGREGRNDRQDRDRPRGPKTDRKPRSDRPDRPAREKRPAADSKPRPTRLKPRRVHRDALIAEVPEEHKPIAEQLLNGGLPAVRTATKGDPNAKQIIAIAEGLAPKLQSAEWLDRAEAAKQDIEQLDLRDLRQVVVAADKGARDETSRALAADLRERLASRIETDHSAWLADLEKAVKEERVIRALRLTSRPVKAGSPIPMELAEPLAALTVVAMNSETPADRWASVLDALAFSPIRNAVKPEFYPTSTDQQFLDVVRSVADRVPDIAAHYGIKPAEAKAAAKRVRAARKAGGTRGRNDRSAGRPSGGERSGGERSGGADRPKRDRKEKGDRGPQVNKGHSDLLKKPSRPRPGTVIAEPEPEPEPEVAAETAEGTPAEAETTTEVTEAVETAVEPAAAEVAETAPEAETPEPAAAEPTEAPEATQVAETPEPAAAEAPEEPEATVEAEQDAAPEEPAS